MSTIRRSYQPQISPFPPDIRSTTRTHTHSRTISAPIHLPSTAIPIPHSAPLDQPGRSRPDLRIITSFPTPPRHRPAPAPAHIAYANTDVTSGIHHPRPVRHPSIPQSSSLPISKRKPVPALHVSVDTDHHETIFSASIDPPVVRTSHSLEKRMNREAAIISREVYTSYHPSRHDSHHWKNELEEPDSPHIIPTSQRRSGRGHKRTLSDKFKSLFSPSPPKARSATLMDDRTDQGRICETAMMEVEEVPERIGVYDESDIPTLSAIYPRPDEIEDLIRGRRDENGQTALLEVSEGPERPYRSPGTASFLVHRLDHVAEEAYKDVMSRDTRKIRRNTFGVNIQDGRGAQVVSSESGGSEAGSWEDEADDETSESDYNATDVDTGH